MGKFFPILLDVREMPVLIVGGGWVAARRARALLEAGARRVCVVAPELREELPGEVERIVERFRPEHLDGRRLVLAATDDPAVNSRVAELCRERGILCGRADEGEGSEVVVPAVRRVGGMTVAASAGVPAVSRQVVEDAAAAAGRWSELAEFAIRLRRRLISAGVDTSRLRALFADVATDEARTLLAAGGEQPLLTWLASRHSWLGRDQAEPAPPDGPAS